MAAFASAVPESIASERDPLSRAILEIAATLGKTLELGDLLEAVMHKIARMLGADRATLFLVDSAQGVVWSRVPSGAGSIEVRLPLGSGLVGAVAQDGALINVADAYEDQRFHVEVDQATGFRTRAVLAVPIRGKDGTIIGVAQVLNKPLGFSAEDEEVLTSVAPLIGLAIENAKLYSAVRAQNEALAGAQVQLHRKVAEVDLLLAIEQELSVASSLAALLDSALVKAQGIFGARSVSLLLVEEGSLELRTITAPGAAVQARVIAAARLGDYVAAALRSDTPTELNGTDGKLPSMSGVQASCLMFAPLLTQDPKRPIRVLGAVEWTDPEGGKFVPDDRALAGTIATQFARAVSVCRTRSESERTSRLAILGRMLGGLVHDMRSPMTVVSGYAEMLAIEDDRSVRERYSGQILSHLEQVNAMSRDVLAFIRGERHVLARRVVLGVFWQDMMPALTRELEPHHVDLKLRLDYAGVARIDENKFQRLVTNLARNAAQAMPSGGTFAITCAAQGETLHVQFMDDGPGMPTEVAARMFTDFNTHGKEGGTGLGLSLVKEVVEGHGGTVSCTSVVGHGTTFDIHLPHAVVV